jgi:hypothetical protein
LCSKLPKSYVERGGIVYTVEKNTVEIDYIDKVMRMDFCEFCYMGYTYADWYQVGSETILYLGVETRSG